MSVRPGRTLVLGLAVLALIAPLTFVWSGTMWLLAAAVLALAAVAAYESRILQAMLNGVRVTRSLPAVAPRGHDFVSRVTLHNGGSRPIAGTLRDVLPGLASLSPQFVPFEIGPASTINASSLMSIPIRGRYTLGPVWVRLVGPMGLVEAQRRLDSTGVIKILPETYASREGLHEDERARLVLLDKLSRTRFQGAGSEFESLNEYRPGDDPRRIDWRTTARLRRPVVRRYQIERHRDVVIAIDCGRLMGASVGGGTKLDCAVDSALMLARLALTTGDRCGIGVFDDAVRGYLAPIGGAKSIGVLAERVYDLESRLRESDFGAMFAELQLKQPRRSLIVIISDLVDEETSERMRASLIRLAQRHVVLLAALRTPVLERTVTGSLESLLDASRKAIAFRLLRQRQRALHSLRRSGVYVVDVEPARLTAPLINQFIDLRGRDLL